MSTKTAFKRIALVAAAALAIGGISAVSANAVSSAPTISANAVQALTVGASASTVTNFGFTAGAAADPGTLVATIAVPGGSARTAANVNLSNGAFTNATGAVVTQTDTLTAVAAGAVAAPVTVSFTPDIAGVYTITLTATAVTTAVQTFTITASNAPVDVVVSNTSSVPVVSAGPAPFTVTAQQIAGPANYVTLTQAAFSPGVSGYYTTVSGGTFVGGATSSVNTTAGSVLLVATPVVGTVTATIYNIVGGAASATAQTTVTITVIGSLPGTLYGASTVYAGPGVAVVANATTDSTFSVTAAGGTPSVANFQVTESDANAIALTAGFQIITATATNGLLSATGGITSAGTTYIAAVPTASGTNFQLSGIAGLSGTSVITISVNGAVVKTYSVIFTGTAVKIVLTAVNSVVGTGVGVLWNSLTGIYANVNALEVQEFDANGNSIAVNTANVALTSGAAAIATAASPNVAGGASNTLGNISGGTATSTTAVGYTVNGISAGSTTFTATDSALVLTSPAVSVRVSSGVPTSVTFTTDQAAYPAGGAGVLTVTLSNAGGTLPSGAYSVTTGQATSSLALAVGTLPGGAAVVGSVPLFAAGTIVVNDAGITSSAFNAPLSDGTATISATSTTASVVVTPASFDISSGASDAANAATDAANEATDAANAATDAANAAADSADAATQAAQDAGDKASAALAAVVALSQQVTAVLTRVASLSALIVRIIKKVKA